MMSYSELICDLLAVHGSCRILAYTIHPDGPPADWLQNIESVGGTPDDFAVRHLRRFWLCYDAAESLLNGIPPDALQDLLSLAGKPWDLATRRILDAIAYSVHGTRHWDDDNPVSPPAEREVILYTWKKNGDFVVWTGLMTELRERIWDLFGIRTRQYSTWSTGLHLGHLPWDFAEPRNYGNGQDIRPGKDSMPSDPYRDLAMWAADNLKGKQRRMIEVLAGNNGNVPLADLNLACEWGGDEFGRCRQHVNRVLHRAGWLVERHDNEARLRQFKGRQK